MLKFYYAKNSAAYAPHILLEDVGADYEAVKIDFASGEQRQNAYLGINPPRKEINTNKHWSIDNPHILQLVATIIHKH